MASIFQTYAIKEVFDGYFYDLNADGSIGVPQLYSPYLKTSSLEITADSVSATGGKGNAEILLWNTNKSSTLTIEDAVFSSKSLAVMLGSGRPAISSSTNKAILKTIYFIPTATTTVAASASFPTFVPATFLTNEGETKSIFDSSGLAGTNTATYCAVAADLALGTSSLKDTTGNLTGTSKIAFFSMGDDGTGEPTIMPGGTSMTFTAGQQYAMSFWYPSTVDVTTVTISATTFPGTYTFIGDTYARNTTSGKDEYLQLIIPKLQILSETTIELSADGDPSVFNLSGKVLKDVNGEFGKLVKYDFNDVSATSGLSLGTY